MDFYITRKQETIRIEYLANNLNKKLYKPTPQNIKNKLTDIIYKNKDASIEDYLNSYIELLIEELSPLLNNHITPGLQTKIKNDYFQIETYGGYFISNDNIKKIEPETKFSLDSISKVFTSIVTMQYLRNTDLNLDTPVKEINNDYKLDATIRSILNFTTCIRTDKRLDNLSKKETIELLKQCKEHLEIKNNYQNFYEYNDIGIMILRQIIPSFLTILDTLLKDTNITYNNKEENITGGKRKEENITPDTKGRDITFPGHTGLYSDITDIVNLFSDLINTNKILTFEEKKSLWKQPYDIPYSYDNLTGKQKCINRIAGIYKTPNNLIPDYDKLKEFDMPNTTTNYSVSSAGTCGSWLLNDKLFNKYTIGLLTNPYTFIENKIYPNEINDINDTPLQVSQKGKIIHYSRHLNPYKEILVNYAIILDLLTEYIKFDEKNITHKALKKEIILPN